MTVGNYCASQNTSSERGLKQLSAQGYQEEHQNRAMAESLQASPCTAEPEDGTTTIADWLADMEPFGPQYLRAVTAGKALRCFARSLWGKDFLYHQSFVRKKKVGVFWSHSWRTPPWKKAGLLLFWYNGNVATIVATLGAVVMFLLCCCDILPGFMKSPWTGPPRKLPFGAWSTLTGSLLYFMVLTGYRSQRTVWLDWMCINQKDEAKKMKGVLSLGANIKTSEKMLVLWDETWIHRLWCVFELSAFLKCQQMQAGQTLTVLPVFIFPFWLANFLMLMLIMTANVMIPLGNLTYVVLGFLGLLFCSIFWERVLTTHFSQISALNERLASFSFKDTMCTCCTKSHKDAYGHHIQCDRELLSQCMSTWFGSEEACEASVSSALAGVLKEKLGARFPFPYWMLLSAGLPWVWGYMDFAAARVRGEEWEEFAAIVMNGVAWWANIGPAITTFSVTLIWKLRSCRRSMVLRWLCRLVIVVMQLIGHAYYRVLQDFVPGRLVNEAIFFVTSLIAAVTAWRLRREGYIQ
ncbi:unnamed protein product [Effrenium voratum]|nr:unnamed protein product [Effrenium voratum]